MAESADSSNTASSATAEAPGAAASTAPNAQAQRVNRNSVWRAKPLLAWLRGRTVYRIVTTGVLLGLVALFGWLVFRPLYHPNARAAFLSGADYHVLRAPPATFALEDADGLKPLASVLVSRGSDAPPALLSALSDPSALRTLAADLTDLTPQSDGVLIVYVIAHGVSDDGTAYLLCRNFDPTNPSAGRVPLADFLKQVKETPAAVKLILLDAGRIPSDPRLGMLVNEFPRLLEREVRQTGDENLWVLSANAAFQRSHVSWSLERSVFGFFAARGLQGAADLNGDRVVDLNELYRYVAANTAAWVREATGGNELQTPVLLWGGGADLTQAQWPALLPVAGGAQGKTAARARASNFKVPAGAVSSPYAQDVQSQFAPVTSTASQNATRKIPGARSAKTTLRAKKKVSKRVERAHQEVKEKKGASGAPKEEAGAKPEPATGTSGTEQPADKGATGETPAAPTGDTAGTAKGTGPSANSPTAAAGKQKESLPAAPPTPADRLAEAWQLRDTLLAVGEQPRPIDFAPQLWRQFEGWLLGEEQLYRAGGVSDPEEIGDTLAALLPRLAKLPNVPPTNAPGQPDLAALFADLAPHAPSEIDSVASLALAQLIATRGGPSLTAEEKAAAETLDRLARDGGPAELSAWIAKLNPELDRFAEVRLARALAALHRADWPTVQLALATSLAGQRAAAVDPALLPWVSAAINRADVLRRAGERTLLDGFSGDRQAQAASWLRQALDLYEQASADAADVAFAAQLEHELLERAPVLYSLPAPSHRQSLARRAKPADIAAFFDRLGQLAALLESPDAGKLEQVRNLAGELASNADDLDTPWSSANVSLLTGRAAPAGRVGRLEALLASPLADADSRDQLLAGLADADSRLADTFHEATVSDLLETPPTPAPAQWRAAVGRAELELALARLAVGSAPDGKRLMQPLDDGLAALRAAVDQLTGDSTSTKQSDAVWTAASQFGVAMRDFYRSLPTQIEAAVGATSELADAAARPARLAALHRAARMARLLDARRAAAWSRRSERPTGHCRVARSAGVPSNAGTVGSGRRADRRRELFDRDGPPYRAAANEMADQPNIPPPSVPPVQLTGPTAVRLTTEPEQTLDYVVRSTVADARDVWLVLDYDPALIEVETAPTPPLYRQPNWPDEHPATGDAAVDAESPRPDRAGLPVSLQLRPDESQTVRLKIRARPAVRDTTRLIIKAITLPSPLAGEGPGVRGHYVRLETEVLLPPPQALELAINAQPGTWTDAESKLLLEPFPNRQTTYRLQLVNKGITDRTVNVNVSAPSEQPLALPPETALAADEAAAVIARFGPTTPLVSLTKLTVPTGGSPVALPFPKAGAAAGPVKEKGAAEKPKEPGGEPKPPEAAAAGASLQSLDHGLLVVVTDLQTQLKTVRWLDVAPQRPRRYVHPKVSFNVERGTVEVLVRAADKSLVPEGGMSVHAELSPLPNKGAQSQLDGRLIAPDYEATLSAETTAEPGTPLTLWLTVNGYPLRVRLPHAGGRRGPQRARIDRPA